MPFTAYLRRNSTEVSGIQLAYVIATFHELGLTMTKQIFTRFDVLLTPTLAHPPGPIGSLRDDDDPEGEFATMAAFMPYTPVQNITGQPSISLPGQPADDGLPIGVMLSGRYGDEATLISLAGQLEAADPWAARKPDVW
jgi:amidase